MKLFTLLILSEASSSVMLSRLFDEDAVEIFVGPTYWSQKLKCEVSESNKVGLYKNLTKKY